MAYSADTDVQTLIGDMPAAASGPNSIATVRTRSDEWIDSKLGFMYVTPLVFDVSDPRGRAASLLVKEISAYHAAGMIVTSQATGGEDQQVHAYGLHLLKQAELAIGQIINGTILLVTVPTVGNEDAAQSGPIVSNVDQYSLVETFYGVMQQNPITDARRAFDVYRSG